MSLINKMLLDLDARRSEVTGGGTYGGQIRAVPERGRMHAAWWVAFVLAAMLAGTVAWILLRPVPPATGNRPQLPLKLDTDLDMRQPSVAQAVPGEQRDSTPISVETMAAPLDKQPAAMLLSEGRQGEKPAESSAAAVSSIPPAPIEKATTMDRPAPVVKAAVAPAKAKKQSSVPVPDAAKTIQAAKPAVRLAAKSSEPAVPVIADRQVKELTPQQRAENEYRKAAALLQQGRTTEAVAGLEQALQSEPQHAAARQALVAVLLENNRRDEALRKAREGLDVDLAQPGLAMILARLQLEKGELRSAIETLERTLSHAAGREDYHALLAALLQRDGRYKDASEHFLLALQKAPQNSVWWMGLGISLQAENRLPQAQEAFGRAKATGNLSPELLAFVESRLRQLQR